MSVNPVIATVKTSVVAIAGMWIYNFCCVISVDVDTGAITVVSCSVLVAFLVYHRIVTSFQITVLLLVMSADRLTVILGVLC